MAQTDAKTEVIEGESYSVFMMPPRRARAMLVEMIQVLGPSLGGMVDAAGGTPSVSKLLSAEMSGTFQAMATALSERLSEPMLDKHMNWLAEVTQVDGKTLGPIFDRHFQGRIGLMFRWYVFALRANFADFTVALASVFPPLPAPAEKAKA